MTEAEMIGLLRQRCCVDRGNGPQAVLLPQVRNRAGFDATRTADALVMQLWPSKGLHLEGFEIKCSRGDVLREFADPTKADAFARYCDRWWLVVADPKMCRPDELPDDWGLLARVERDGIATLRVMQRAPLRDVPAHLPKDMLASIFRQFDRMEG